MRNQRLRTIDPEGELDLDRLGSVVAENTHHVEKILERHVAITGWGEHFTDTILEWIHLKVEPIALEKFLNYS